MADEEKTAIWDPGAQQDKTATLAPQQAVTPQVSTPQQSLQQAPQQVPGTDRIIDFLRPFIGNVAGLGAQGVAAMVPVLGQNPITQFAAGTQAYAGVDTMLQYLKQNSPKTFQEALSEGEKEAMINEVGGRIFGALFKGLGGIRNAGTPEIYKLFPTTSQALENYGFNKLSNVTQFLENVGAPSAKIAARGKSGEAAAAQALQFSNMMNGRGPTNLDPELVYNEIRKTIEDGLTPGATAGKFQSNLHYASKEALDMLNAGDNPMQALDDMILDKPKLDKLLAYGQKYGTPNMNMRNDLQAYQFQKMFNDATVVAPGGKSAIVDPKKLSAIWDTPENQPALNTLYGTGLKKNLDQFIQNVITTQSGQPANTILGKIKYAGGGFILDQALAKLLEGHGLSEALITGLYVSAATMGRILTNPKVAQGLADQTKLLSTTAKGRAIFDALQGAGIALVGPRGDKIWGTVDRQPNGTYEFERDRQ